MVYQFVTFVSPCEREEFGPDVKEQVKLLYFRQEEVSKEAIIDEHGFKVNNNLMRKHLYGFLLTSSMDILERVRG